MERWACRPRPVGATRQGARGESSLDVVSVPAGEAWRWSVATGSGGPLSDHAVLVACVDAGGRAVRPCAGRILAGLPSKALLEL
eukprot:15042032-Alexandrium_andersonii.AAC.1